MNLPEPVMYKTMWGDLYTAAQMIEYRNAALEDAARACEQQITGYQFLATRGYWDHMDQAAVNCAAAIRSLKECNLDPDK